MLDKFSLTDKECENLAKGIAIGVGFGVIVGAIIGNIALTFSAGGVFGIIGSLIYSFRENHKKRADNEIKIDEVDNFPHI